MLNNSSTGSTAIWCVKIYSILSKWFHSSRSMLYPLLPYNLISNVGLGYLCQSTTWALGQKSQKDKLEGRTALHPSKAQRRLLFVYVIEENKHEVSNKWGSEKISLGDKLFSLPPNNAIQVCEICNAQRSSSRDREAKPRAQGTIWLQTAQIS